MDVRKIKTAPGLEFDCSLSGSPDGVPVLLLHGFGVSRHFWDRQVPALADAGYFAIAPNQRGYSPGARPDPKDLDAYHIDRLVGDALDIVAAASGLVPARARPARRRAEAAIGASHGLPRARRRPEVVGEQLRMATLAPHASGHARGGDRCPY